MFYLASKALWPLAEPANLLLALILMGVGAGLLGWRRLSRVLMIIGLASFAAIASLPVGTAILAQLEGRFPAWHDDGPVDGLIVLGGAIEPSRYFYNPASGMNGAIGRIIEAARIARKYPAARIIFSGGGSEPGVRGEAEAALDLFVALGVDPQRVTLERMSRNTQENAYFARAIATPKPDERWLLITSAFHMPRAVGCFRAAGFSVIASPVDYKTTMRVRWLQFDLERGVRDFDLGVHEVFGLVVYRLMGQTDAFFPAP